MSAPFTHHDPGTPAPAWTPLITGLEAVAPPGVGAHLIVVGAHPDDETLGAGGLLATAAAAGARITVIVATDGEASHPQSPTHTPDGLAERRRREVYTAIAELAPRAEISLLGLPDGRLVAHVPDLVAAIDAAGADATHLVTPWRGDRHPDHEACAQAAAQSATARRARHWQYPIWAWHWSAPEQPDLAGAPLFAIDLAPAAQDAKARAIERYRSQHEPLSDAPGDEAILDRARLEHFRHPVEVFVRDETVSTDYFVRLYEHAADPWGLEERFYERRKRAALLAALTRPRFRRAFEPGCATGLLTRELARRCTELVAWDVAAAAVERTRARLGAEDLHSHVRVDIGAIPDQWPEGQFDLIVVSEVGYYCHDLDALTARVDGSLTDDGVLIACHWRHDAPMHPHSTGAVHAALGARRKLVVSHVEDDFLLQAWTDGGTSVAVAEGLVP